MDKFSYGKWNKAKNKHEIDLNDSKRRKWIWLKDNGFNSRKWIFSHDFSRIKTINANNTIPRLASRMLLNLLSLYKPAKSKRYISASKTKQNQT